MKGIIGKACMGLFSLGLMSGCLATKDYVKVKAEAARNYTEARVSGLESELNAYFEVCKDGRYDFDTRCVDFSRNGLETAMKSVQRLDLYFRMGDISDKMNKTTDDDKVYWGSGILLEGGKILTARHLLELKTEDFVRTSRQGSAILIQLLTLLGRDVDIYIDKDNKIDLDEVEKSDKHDIALLKINEGQEHNLPKFPFKIGNSDELRIGNKVYAIGNAAGLGITVREAIVSKTYSVEPGMFEISEKLENGTSGGAVIALRDGVPELVGIITKTYGGVLRINEALKEFKKL